MKAVYYEDFGDADVLQVGERPVPAIGPNDVLVEVGAASVNPIDRRLRAGELQDFFQREWPITPGWDLSGRISEIGSEVSGWSVGDEVVGLAFNWQLGPGTYAEYARIDAGSIAAKPPEFSHEQAACIPLVGLTAWQSLVEYGEVCPGQRVFIQAGAGGLGNVAIQIAKHRGAFVYTTCRADNEDYVKSLGADVAIDYTANDYVEVLRTAEPKGLDLVLELLLDPQAINSAIDLVRPGGVVVYMNNEPPDLPAIEAKDIKTQFLHHRADGPMLAEIVALYADGTLKLPEIEVMSLDAAAQAHRQSESGRTRGKVVLQVNAL